MTLSRCGRQYTFEDALKAAQSRSFKSTRKHSVTSCPFGDHWHVREGSTAQSRPDPFPPAVRAQLVTRDECCQRCGSTGRLEAHHRRAKHMGGSKGRSHTQCACNGVMVCRRCHSWIHSNPSRARGEGWIVSQSVSLPSSIAFCPYRRDEDDTIVLQGVRWVFPTCEGGWSVD